MFERRTQPLLPIKLYYRRVVNYALFAFAIVVVSLLIGILGYHFFERLSWLDALLNASMILGGMGPINPLQTVAGKIFASCYALFSGIIFLVAVAVLMAPALHRLLHHLHLEMKETEDGGEGQ
ncbi:MAG TPA: hypothetical protein VGM23_02860 [Armatimonadota bacterium]|jgi:hypothetical protein